MRRDIIALHIVQMDVVAGGGGASLRTDFPTSVQHVFSDNPKAGMVYEGDFVGALAPIGGTPRRRELAVGYGVSQWRACPV